MNVTNRRISTDADTTPTTQTSHHQHNQQQPQQHQQQHHQQQQQQQHHHHHQQLLSYVSCRQAATATTSSRHHHTRSSRQEVDDEDDQEPVVTSTSADCLLPLQAEGEGEEVSIDLDAAAVVTSPARITSSTNNYDILNYSSTDSLSLEEEMVMPTTSENAARIEREETTSTSTSFRLIHRSISNSNSRATKASTLNDMVARDTTHTTVADAAQDGGGGGGNVRDINDQAAASTSNNSDSHKIILKLPKTSSAAATCESQATAENEDDPRKVEPLKINLHNTHHHHNTHHTPKITIKPILKESATDTTLVSSEECSSSAEDDIVSKLNNSEPHIVPKLTIRAKNEDYGSSHTTVVPKLTIKINDPANSDCLSKSTAALNTPPLPKLTIKTGQDGHTESIITNVSPASSTTSSSSSLASCSATSLSSTNSVMATCASTTVPKLTIKPLQKSQDFMEQQLPSIPKLCIKTNTLTTDVSGEEPTASKIPKLTIKTGQEHAVIITQHHNDNVKNSGGIPKMTIKTKSLDVSDDSSALESSSSSVVDKIPKLTIKTNNSNESIPKLCINKAQLEASSSSSSSTSSAIGPLLSPKQPVVPKLTISRQSVQAERVILETGDGAASATGIPKMTIKTQSNKPECVPKLTLKSVITNKRPAPTEASGISDDPECEDHIKIVECNKTVPKLTIKNVGSPQQKLKIVVDTKGDSHTKQRNPIPTNPPSACEDVELLNPNEDPDEFSDLLNVDNAGEESSNSQEFCGFNETPFVEKQNVVEEYRRQSDDMDIDESLQNQHEPQIFQNPAHFEEQSLAVSETELNGKSAALDSFPKMTHIIDTVDLTSSAGSSPAAHRFECNEEVDVQMMENTTTQKSVSSLNKKVPQHHGNILLERLQRETSVIQNTQNVIVLAETNSIPPPPLQPKPPILLVNNTSNATTTTSRYPELMERLMTNGSMALNMNTVDYSQTSATTQKSTEENIIDSIEILDTPEGSPRTSLDERPEQVKSAAVHETPALPNGLHYPKELLLAAFNNNNSNLKRHATPMMINNSSLAGHNLAATETNLEGLPSKLRKLQNDNSIAAKSNIEMNKIKVLESNVDEQQNSKSALGTNVIPQAGITNHQRSRKQKHEHLLPLPIDEVVDSMQTNAISSLQHLAEMCNDTPENKTFINKRKSVRARKTEVIPTPNAKEETTTTPTTLSAADNKSRRVQLLRKRLAIDMVDAEQPIAVIDNLAGVGEFALEANKEDELLDTPRKERSLRAPLRTSRRSNTPTTFQIEAKQTSRSNKPSVAVSFLAMENNKKALVVGPSENVLNHFLESNSSSISSSASSSHSATITATMAGGGSGGGGSSNSGCLSMATQIDLTMSSSSSNSNGSTTNTITTVEATTLSRLGGANGSGIINISGGGGGGGGSSNNSMLPPTTILSSSDPLQDVIFRPNDFSSIIATQQLRGTTTTITTTMPQSIIDQTLEDEMLDDASGLDYSEDDSASSSSMSNTPGRSGRGRGRSVRGGRAPTGRAYRAHRLGRGASAAAKAIAVNRPRWVGTLKHTPDPERIKGLFSPSPQVFEEDTRMSADLTQTPTTPQPEPPSTPIRQPDFLNNEESQSSIISNTSILDPNNVLAIQNGSAVKKTVRKKKMEVCVSEDTDYTVASIAEYDWPRPKGCCPSKTRDTFMIQEQVANYLGIKSFKRKYPDLPRRQVDMEERNWLQEQGLVSEKMCDLGITAVWASDILDIMYSDFYEKYEEYKDYVRQKHLREIEAKQKSLGLNVAGRGLQARERAMLNTSKWNAYFNKTRKDERLSCLDLQTLVVNKPSPATAPISTIPNRPVADAVALAAKVEHIPQPPTLMKPRMWEPIRCRDVYYPLSLVPGQFCEKYQNYSAEELRRFPLNTVLIHPQSLWQRHNDELHSSDTDSAVESIENDLDTETSIASGSKLVRKRRVRRTRNKHLISNDEFKIPPLPGTSASATSSNDSSSSSDESSSSDTASESSRSSSSSEESSSSSEDENSPATCGVCLHPQNRNLKDVPELFVQCYTCRRKVHPSCIEMPHRMSTRVRNYNWQCAECKCCVKCKGRQYQNKMLFCEQCDRGFHVYCLGVKSVPDGRWSCDRCCICMRCGATKPEGLPMAQLTNNNKQSRHKKVKWVKEYRVDHITKIKEHCSMLCVPCGRMRTTKRVQISTHNNTTATSYMTSPGSSGALSPNCSSGPCSPAANFTNISIANVSSAPTVSTLVQNDLQSTTAEEAININSTSETLTTVVVAATNISENKINSSSPSITLVSSSAATMSTDFSRTKSESAITATTESTSTTSSSASTSTTGDGSPPVVA